MIEFLKPYSQQIIIVGNGLLLISLFLFVFCLVRVISQSKKIEKLGNQLVKVARNSERSRQKEERKRQLLEGEVMQRSMLARIDRKIAHSGLKEIGSYVTTETVLFAVFLLTTICIVFGGVYFGTKGMILGLFAGISIPYMLITYFASKRSKQIESQLITFLNLIDNYSKTSDDIISIFEKISIYLEPPLSNLLEETCLQTRMNGNSTQALKELNEKIGHPKMKEIIDNIEIASRHEADYSIVIEDERRLVNNYLNDIKDKQSMLRNARIEYFIMLIIGCIIAFTLSAFFGISISTVFNGVSILSKVTIGVAVLTVLYTIKNLFLGKR